jgi:hypothetical protein
MKISLARIFIKLKTKHAMFMRLAGQYAANSRMLIAHTVFITPLCGFDLLSISLLLEPALRSGFIVCAGIWNCGLTDADAGALWSALQR